MYRYSVAQVIAVTDGAGKLMRVSLALSMCKLGVEMLKGDMQNIYAQLSMLT